ncbi:MAG: iron ABC transporter permease [Planctomycetota bacterium]|nr:iron ABC transporter permease [Planctomycetota bacterium]
MDRTRPHDYLIYWVIMAVLAAVLLWPIWLTVRGAFLDDPASLAGGYTLYHVAEVFRDPILLTGLLNAFAIAACTTILSILIATPMAWLVARFDFAFKAILSAFLLVPLIIPPFVGAIGMKHLLGEYGSVNMILMDLGLRSEPIDFLGDGGFWGIVLIEALHLYPIIYLNIVASLANLDPALDEAARNVGAGPVRRALQITVPLIRSGVFAGSTIVFIWSFTELGTPLMFDFEAVTPVQIFNGIQEMEASSRPYALTAVMLISVAACYLLGRWVFGGRGYAMYSKASRAATEHRLRGWTAVLAILSIGFVVLVASLPHLSVILTSLTAEGQWYQSILPRAFTLDHYEQALGHPLAVGSIRTSLMLALAAMVLDIAFGVVIARLLVRTRVRGRWLLDALVMLPLAVPGLVMAFGYVAMSLRWPFNGSMPDWLHAVCSTIGLEGTGLFQWLDDGPLHPLANILGQSPNPIPLLILAYAVRRRPYVVRSAVAGLEQTPVQLEEAAANLGSGWWHRQRKIVLPLIAANLLAGGLLAFSFAMLEVSDSLILAQREADFPITKAIYVLYQRLGDGQYIASAMGVWAMLLLAATLVGSSLLMGKKMGAIFRV